MQSEIDWDDIEVIPNYSKETQLMTLTSKKESDNALWSFLDLFSDKWGVEITNKNVITYDDTNLENENREIKMKKIKALYLNEDRNQLLIKVCNPPNEIIFTTQAVEVAKTILSVKRKDNIPVYDMPVKSLNEYVEQKKLPSPDYIWNKEGDERHSASDEEYKHPSVIYPGLKKRASGDSSEHGEQDHQSTASQNHDDLDAYDSDDDEAKLDSENNRLNREKSVCLITTETLDNFTLLKVIGKGAFGRVFLAKKNTGEVFAMKRIRKDRVLRSGAVENILLERKILSEVNHPLLLSLRHVFSSKYRFYFFCDYIIGGDLMRHLDKMKTGFTLSQVKFIASQLVLAFECLHEHKIIHRDLKPENVLIDEEGYIRLADFGLAKDLTEELGTGSCGTLEYMAPEIVSSAKGHNYEVDWWTLGILMYELYYKRTPFLADTRDEIIDNIKNKPLEFPDDDEEEENKNLKYFKNIIRKMLKKDPSKRLGHSRKNQGARKVKKHPFFRAVAWSKILDKSYESPYVPKVDTKKIKKYLKKKGCKIGVVRKDGDENGKLAETDLPTRVKRVVDRNESKFNA